MTEYTVHFQKGFRIGAHSLRMVNVMADTVTAAIKAAKAEFSEPGYKLTRVDHFEGNSIVIDR